LPCGAATAEHLQRSAATIPPMSIVSLSRQVRPAAGDRLCVAVERDFDFLSAEYRSLHRRSHTSAFQGPDWHAGLYRRVAPAFRADPFTLTVRANDDQRLLLVLPLVRRRRGRLAVVEFADFGLCDYNHAIYDPVETPLLLADASLPERVGGMLDGCDVLSISKLTGRDRLLRRLFPSARWARMRFSAYPARLGNDWAGWREAKLAPGLRRELDLKRRRLAKKGAVTFTRAVDAAEIARVFAHLRRFRADRFSELGVPDPMRNEAVFSFYRDMAVQGAHSGTTRTHCLYLDDEPIAALFGLADRSGFLMLLLGADLKRFRRLTVGLLAVDEAMRAAFEAGDRVYDFTVGDHPYKRQFAAETMPLYECHVPRSISGYGATLALRIVREFKRAFKPLHADVQRVLRRLQRYGSGRARARSRAEPPRPRNLTNRV
jgi:CelD/BcsL family acetyltransferase involved in cellulose biosynthesis